MAETFKDHFSAAADGYVEARPDYPHSLAARLVEGLPAAPTAWECGCGSGQLSLVLAGRVGRLIATDASARQIGRAPPHRRIDYRVAAAEASGLPDRSIDLVVSAQAAHWFDLPKHWQEVRRVARPGARVALICYPTLTLAGNPAADALFQRFYHETIGPWWPPERALVEGGYADLDFPFADRPAEQMEMRFDWPLDRLLAYVATMSAVKECRIAMGRDPLPDFAAALGAVWGPAERRQTVVWPLILRLGTVPG